MLRAVEPAALELSLRAAERVEQDRERLHRHWRQRLERAEYEADRARRQYDAVDPENRLVARELERQWEQKLAEQQRLEEDYARFQHEQPRHLTAADRERIRALAADVPALWQAATTTMADRRAIVRQLVERVVVTRRGETEVIDVVIHWLGGSESRHEVHQGLRRYDGLGDYARLKERVTELRGDGRTGEQIAEALNQEGYRTPRGGTFTGHRVRRLFMRFGIDQRPGRCAWPRRPAGQGRVVAAGAGRRTGGAADRGASVAVVGVAARPPVAGGQRPLDRVGRPIGAATASPVAGSRAQDSRSRSPIGIDNAEGTPDRGVRSGEAENAYTE